uniref:Uncharacterized protein n=1 Tax=Anguilla anguilla TaxID=7936 RepID=A0A0E9RH79_ANGAN
MRTPKKKEKLEKAKKNMFQPWRSLT